ncbi:NmrA family NAD(P)-binding protein [Synechococcus sp. CCY 0621]|uniref:NmrA family NAD(P)-binding protein n=1 Tax=Synechococcus sp. CCY 0621 TaxID=2815603 RepID=UPI001C224FF0|nr:NmrA family NAD(P)-binding protein [Synechococcus sp. CCY 0621]
MKGTVQLTDKRKIKIMASYVVLGATGQTGAVTVNALMGQATVRVAVRNESKGAAWKAQRAEVAIVEDFADVDALGRAFEGVLGAYVLNPPDYASDDLFAWTEQVISAIVEAARRTRLPRIVVLSSIGGHLPRGTGNILTAYRMEEKLKSLPSKVAIGFVRAAGFMENWRSLLPIKKQTGRLPSFYAPLDRAVPMISAIDIGQTRADMLIQTWQNTQVRELHGLHPLSPNDVAASFSKALERDVQAIILPEREWSSVLAQMGSSPATVRSYSEMICTFNAGTLVFEENGTNRIQGKITIDDVVHSWLSSNSLS